MTSLQLNSHLRALSADRAAAALEGVNSGPYVEDLHAEIAATREALVLAALIDIAELRAELSGRLQG
jgi:hypothetical protein